MIKEQATIGLTSKKLGSEVLPCPQVGTHDINVLLNFRKTSGERGVEKT